jgi:hypothetical protein
MLKSNTINIEEHADRSLTLKKHVSGSKSKY